MIDLHVHSTCSDGSFTPKELVEYALTHNITAFALTDHDTVDGLDEAIGYADALSGKVCEKNPEGKALTVIPGIELSTEYEGRDVHIVGLFIEYKSEPFQNHITEFIRSRHARNEQMCALLQQHGIPVSYEYLLREFPGSVITRAHYGRYLLEKGYVKSISEAFDRYVGDYACCFVPRKKVTPKDAVLLIRACGGIPVLAHPVLYHMSEKRLALLTAELADAGLLGIEALYPTYTPADTRKIQGLAKKYRLAVSGGSDFHGTNKPGLSFGTGYGKLYIPEDILENLKKLKS